MVNKKRSPLMHWLSFFPALAFWWLEETQPIEIALGVGLILSVLEVSIEKWLNGHVHTLSRLNFGIILVLGSLALFAKEGILFKLQPTFTGYICGLWLSINQVRGRVFIVQTLEEMGKQWPFPQEWLKSFERHVIAFMFGYGTFMAYWAIWGSTGQWAFWKTGGQYISFGLFLVLEFWWLRRKIKQERA
jgi:intracellular septation protein